MKRLTRVRTASGVGGGLILGLVVLLMASPVHAAKIHTQLAIIPPGTVVTQPASPNTSQPGAVPATPQTSAPAAPAASPGTSQPGSVAPQSTGSAEGLSNPLNVSSLQALLAEILTYVVILGSILLTVMIIYVGFLFVMARGNPEAVSSARSALLWTVIGGLILLGASAIATVIAATASSL